MLPSIRLPSLGFVRTCAATTPTTARVCIALQLPPETAVHRCDRMCGALTWLFAPPSC